MGQFLITSYNSEHGCNFTWSSYQEAHGSNSSDRKKAWEQHVMDLMIHLTSIATQIGFEADDANELYQSLNRCTEQFPQKEFSCVVILKHESATWLHVVVRIS